MKKIFLAGFLAAALSITICGNIKEVQAAEESADSVSAADMETLYHENLHKWTTGTTWKASNGVELKINDAFADSIKAGDLGTDAAIWYEDPDRDPTPNSPYMDAFNEFIYGANEAYLNGKDRYNPEVVDISKLPDIPLATSKQTSVVETDESRAYKKAYDVMQGFQLTGKWKANPANLLQFGYSNGTGIGLTHMAWDYTWTLQYNGSEWVLTIINNLSELQWDGIHNSLRLISPDGDAIYNAVFEQFYYRADWIVDYDGWYPIPNSSSEIYVPSSNAQVLDYGRYYFR